jgi:hypothetical protein
VSNGGRTSPWPSGPLVPIAAIGLGALALWLAFGHGFANYDTFYSLVWGDELAHGESPDYDAPIPPTPHPLATLVGLLLSPAGDDAEGITVALAFIALAAVGYLTYRLGERWFNRWVGLLAAAIVLTREPVLSYGVRAYVDVPFIAFVLAALLVETKRPRAGWPVLALLVPAGLLRPEAWLFSVAYLLYLAYTDPGRPPGRLGPILSLFQPGRLLGLTILAVSAPVLWALYDLAFADDPLYSLTGTQDTVETLGRDTGPVDAVTLGPRRIGEILREPGLLAATGGIVFGFAFFRRRALLGIVAAAVAIVAFLILASAGLAVITRYLLLAAAILSIFAGAAVLGWLDLERENRWRRLWIAFGAIVVVATIAFVPSQYVRLSDLQDSISTQERIRDDLHDLAQDGAFAGAEGDDLNPACSAVTVPNHRPVPLLALWLDRRPSEIVSAQVQTPTSGYFADPATPEVEREFTLDPNDPGELTAEVPPGFVPGPSNESWNLYFRC